MNFTINLVPRCVPLNMLRGGLMECNAQFDLAEVYGIWPEDEWQREELKFMNAILLGGEEKCFGRSMTRIFEKEIDDFL